MIVFLKHCNVSQTKTKHQKQEKTANIYITCKYIIIQIAVFYKHGNFLWIGNDDHYSLIPSKWFGDIPRAMHQ